MKFLFYVQFQESFSLHENWGTMGAREIDEMKRIFLETNPYFLALTVFISILHLVFEYLAFSNDVTFWRGRTDFKGLSLRSVAVSCYFSTVTFLYLLDGDETSWTVLAPSGIGVLIEYWKFTKTVTVERLPPAKGQTHVHGETSGPASPNDPQTPAGGLNIWRWRIQFNKTYNRSKTHRYDEIAMRYLFYLTVPCLLGYTVYSALNDTYKGWYSFFITTQVRFIYFTGFVLMTPQIFINYKMKSVTCLPWKTFVYKALNTFIDDLFAFIIKMPTLHRLACFRDDIVFIVLLYQRWIYPVDKKRTEDISDHEDVESAKLRTSEAEGKCTAERRATDGTCAEQDGTLEGVD
jgi:hypothetical protein